MPDDKQFAQKAKEKMARRPIIIGPKEHVEIKSTFVSVEEMITWDQTQANIKLRDRLVWACIFSIAVELLFIYLHAAKVITLPYESIVAVSAMMGGSAWGLGGLLYYIARDLFPPKKDGSA